MAGGGGNNGRHIPTTNRISSPLLPSPFLGANWSSLRETADPYNRNRYSHFVIEQTHLIKLASQVSQSQVEHGAAGQWPWPRLTP